MILYIFSSDPIRLDRSCVFRYYFVVKVTITVYSLNFVLKFFLIYYILFYNVTNSIFQKIVCCFLLLIDACCYYTLSFVCIDCSFLVYCCLAPIERIINRFF